jgi:predicted flap endonuclease-1-like 5' DNA nuclease
MTSAPHIIETALLLLVAYVVGCVIGDLARRLTMVRAAAPAALQPASATTEPPSDTKEPEPVPVALVELPHQPPLAAPELPEEVPAVAAALPDEIPAVAAEPPEEVPVAVAEPAPVAVIPLPAPPIAEPGDLVGLAEPRNGAKNNLKEIKGIGPKIESRLNDLGVFHFDQIAAWDQTTITLVETQLGFKGRVGRENWVAQSKAKLGAEQESRRKTA